MAQNRVLPFTIPCGKGGLNRMENYLDFPVEDLSWVDGLTVEHNAWEKEGGASKLNTVGTLLTNASANWTVAVTSNVVTVDTIADHGWTRGYTFDTNASWTANAFMASLSGKTVLTTPTTSTFTFALTQGDQGATTETNAAANMTPTPPGILAVHDAWNSSPSGDPTVPEATTQTLLVIANSTVGAWNVLSTAGTVLSSQDLTEAPTNPWFVNGVIRGVIRTQIMFAENFNPLYVVPETYSVQTTAFGSADWTTNSAWPHFGFAHNFRVVCATKLGSILYMSNPQDHTQFDSGSPNTRLMDVYPGEEHYISAGVSWRGRAYLFKWERGVYYVDDSDSNIANWRTIKVTDAIGAAGPGCVVSYEDDVVILGSDGYFYSLSDVQTLGQKSVKPILPTELGDFIRTEINTGRLDLVRSVYYPRKRQIWFALPATGGTTLNRRLIFDANLPGKIRILWSERDEMTCLTTWRDSNIMEPLWGDTLGNIWVGDQAARNKDSAAYIGQFETPPYSLFPADDRFANLKELNVTFKPKGAYDLTLEVHADDALSQTLTLSQQSSGSPSGSFSLDAEVLAGTVIGTEVVPLEGEARRVKFVGKNEEVDENFAIQALNVRHTPGSHSMA